MATAFFFSAFASARAASFSTRIAFNSAWASALAVAAATIRALASSTFLLFPAFLSAAFFEFISDLAALYLASVNADFFSTAFLLFPAFLSAAFFEFISDLAALYLASVNADFFSTAFLLFPAFLRAAFRSIFAFASACVLFAFAALILTCAFARFRLAFSRSVTVFALANALSAILAFFTALFLLAAASLRATSFSLLTRFNSFCIEAFAIAVAVRPADALAASLLVSRALLTILLIISFGSLPFLIPVLYSFINAVLFVTPIFVNNVFNLLLFRTLELRSRRVFSSAAALIVAFFAFISFLAALYLASDNAAFLVIAFLLAAAAVAALFLFLITCASFKFNSFVALATAVSVLFVSVVTSLVNFSISALALFNSVVSRSASTTLPLLACTSKRDCRSLIRTLSWSRSVSISPTRCSLFSTCNVTAFKSD